MAEPQKLIVRVIDVTGRPVPSAQVAVTVRRGSVVLDQFPAAPAPRELQLRTGFVGIEIRATAPQSYAEEGELFFNVFDRWNSTNCCWKLSENTDVVNLDITLGRVRYAPVISVPPTQEVPPDYTPRGIALDERPQYRNYWPESPLNMMILRRPAKGNLDLDEWERFAHDPFSIKLGDAGNWLFLQYGDPDGEGNNLRYLLGVWAPHSVPGRTPPIVVQLTPNPTGGTFGPTYPVDRFPFTGVYPFRMLPGALPKPPATTVPFKQTHQRYADLAIDRSLLTWWAVPQIYGARPDLFSGPNGPIVITVVPAITNEGVQRDPMSHREGIGRMTAEVLRFLWSRRLTLAHGTGRMRLLFPSSGAGSVTEVSVGRDNGPVDGFPSRVTSTVLTHSAGVGALAQLAGPQGAFPKKNFPQDLWGGCLSYGDNDWKGIWLIDGVARDKDGPPLFQPSKGSPVVNIWKSWVKEADNRSFVAVYCEAGLAQGDQNGLVAATRVSGRKGWIEEAQTPDRKIAWLRVSNSLLAPSPSTAFPNVVPTVGGRGKPHDDIYTMGIGYAARRAP
ncbi:hypothetical protein ACF06V_37945 [Streptomyces bobili]|uniref:hypothetical protein n=1 Tax=Streptomyces bobili TaxID=67280 RepID=UPI0036FAC400